MTTRRILCVWLPHWATTRLRHARTRSGAPPDERLGTVEAVRGVRRLAGVCERAAAAGVHAGQTLTQARALCPELVVADAEPAEDAAALVSLAQWATRYTPLVAPCPPDALWLDIAGCEHLHGGEDELAKDLTTRLQNWGLTTHHAIAPTTGWAWGLVHSEAKQGQGALPPGPPLGSGGRAPWPCLSSLPIEALRLDPAVVAGLRRLGVKTVEALQRLPRSEVAARFGAGPGWRLDQASGAVVEPVAWLAAPVEWCERERFAEPLLTTEGCMAALEVLAARLCGRLDAQRSGGRQFVAGFVRVDGTTREIGVATSLPVRDAGYLLKLLGERLQGLDPGYGIEAVWLAAPRIEAVEMVQAHAFAGASAQVQQRLAQLIDALANRLLPGRLWRAAPRDSHIPEQAAVRVAPLVTGPRWEGDAAAPRPIRLLERPEPIEVMAPLPDDPPVQFRWRGALHRVRVATGPERIAGEWWAAGGGTRDYYSVEDGQGSRFWMYRVAGSWFLHGLFG